MGAASPVSVLLIDDDEQQWYVVQEYLREAIHGPIDCDWVGTYAQARMLLDEPAHDLILLDQFLDEKTGLDLLDECPDVCSRVPVILLTGRDHPELDQGAMARGVVDYLDKNHISPVLLERAIRYSLNNFQAQQALRKSAAQYEGILNAAYEGMVVHDGERILEANLPFSRLAGVRREQLIGARLLDVLGQTLEHQLTPPRLPVDAPAEVAWHAGHNGTRIVEACCRSHCYEGRDVYLLTLCDITARKCAETQLAQANAELEQRVRKRTAALHRSNQELERFAQVVAHDIQVPLRTVEQYIKELRIKESESSDREAELRLHFVDRAIQSVLRMQELVAAMLEYSRLLSEKRPMGEVEIAGLVQDVLAELEPEYRQVNVVVSLSEMPRVTGNPAMLADLFRNLLHNAMKYRRENAARIEIGSQEHGDNWLFTIQDNGVGFRPEEAELLFVALHRGANSSRMPGHGLGLAVCKKIVEEHGGRIWAEARPGQGASFHFTLPKLATALYATDADDGTMYENGASG